MVPSYATLVEHGVFAGYSQGSEVYLLGDTYWQADEYTTPDGPWFDVYPWKGSDPASLPQSHAEKIVFVTE